MTENASAASVQAASTTPVQPSSQDPTVAANAAQSNSTATSSFNSKMSTKIGSLADLKKKAPKVYHQMMIGIATSIIKQMHKQQEDLKKMWREGEQG